MDLNVTQVEVTLTRGGSDKLKAWANITIDGCFKVRSLRVIEDREGRLFVAMPQKEDRAGLARDVAHPLNRETRQGLEELVLGEYQKKVLSATGKQV